MTRGRAWIGVLGVLLVGIVALNVVTLSLSASAGHIDQNIGALEDENSLLNARVAHLYGSARVRHEAAGQGLAAASQIRSATCRLQAGRGDRRPAAVGGLGLLEATPDEARSSEGSASSSPASSSASVVVGARAFWLQGVQGSKLASEAISQQTEAIPLPSLRGSVLDRHGNALAASEDAATIFAVAVPEVNKPALAAEKLAPILISSQGKVLEAR